tara:strand:+ start:300 stop:701 length:402 start_codon:yes stop_codon:yes gene_type:complete
MPQVKYTTSQGLIQQTGSGFVSGYYHPGGSTTSAADSLAIPVTNSVVAKTTGGDAEALTIVDGTPGQVLHIYIATDGGGDGTLTAATNSTGTGWATIVFADVGDRAVLCWVDDTIGWIILGLSGKAGPPVTTV